MSEAIHAALSSLVYWTVIIPYVGLTRGTKWHPTEGEGPFSTLSRGAFDTEAQALAWAEEHLPGHSFTLRRIGGEVLEITHHGDGTATRLHYALVLRGTPRRNRRTWIVGYGVGADGVARQGGNCHSTEVEARKAYAAEVAAKGVR